MTIRWEASLAIGHDEIDAQHQRLFERVDALVESMGRRDRAAAAAGFDFLGAYVTAHFSAEERLMEETEFPGLTVHRALHDRFVRDYRDLRAQFETHGPHGALAIKANTWLCDWLRTHIAGPDQHIARHLVRRAG